MSFEIATAKVDITPRPGVNPYMAGYGVQTVPRVVTSDSPHDEPLWARCVILWENGNPHAIVSLDILGIPREIHLAVRPRLIALANWASSDIVLVASHTHNSPALSGAALDPYIAYDVVDADKIHRYSAWLQDQIVAVVTNALNASRTAVTLEYRVATATFSRNRAGQSTNETAVPVITARADNGTPRVVMFSYGCHPVSAGWQEQWDGDFPSVACTVVEDQTSAFPMFLPGPAGDQVGPGVRGWSLRDQHGTALGNAVVGAVRATGRAIAGPILSQLRDVALPLEITPTPSNLAAVRAAYITRMGNPEGQPAYYQRHAESMITRIDAGNVSTSVPNPSQVWRIGGAAGLKMAFLGGEIVSGYAAYFRARNGGADGLYIGGYANEVSCYIPSDALLPPLEVWGSYEGGWDPDFPGIAGGSMAVYPHIAHFRAGAGGVESTLISALNAQLG